MTSESSNIRRVALVTGASRGIGRAIAVALGREGYHVVVNYKSREDEATTTVEQVEAAGGAAELKAFDVADPEGGSSVPARRRTGAGR